MSDNQHTPGPWVVFMDKRRAHSVMPAGRQGDICFMQGPWSDEEINANASLLSAAPELLEALIWFVENDDTNEGDEPMPEHNGETWNEINAYWLEGLSKARAAIAKATGAS